MFLQVLVVFLAHVKDPGLEEVSGSSECLGTVAVVLYSRVAVFCSETLCVSEIDVDAVSWFAVCCS